MRWTTFSGLSVLVLAVAGCDIPKDPEGTLERVRGNVMRVGLIEQEPWAQHEGGQASGVEVELVNRLAQQLGSRVEWQPGGETELFERLENHELDLVIGGVTASTPWAARLGLTLPHTERTVREQKHQHVLAAPPGENAWLLELDRFIHANKSSVPPAAPSPEGQP